MFGLGFGELLVIMVVALLVVGPKNLPQVARKLGRLFAELRRSFDDVKREINLADLDVRDEIRELNLRADWIGDSDSSEAQDSDQASTTSTGTPEKKTPDETDQ